MRAPRARWAEWSGVSLRAWLKALFGTPAAWRTEPGAPPFGHAPAVLGPERFQAANRPCSFGEPARDSGLLSSVLVAPAVLLPERFRGGCAFGSGGGPRSLPRESLKRWAGRPGESTGRVAPAAGASGAAALHEPTTKNAKGTNALVAAAKPQDLGCAALAAFRRAGAHSCFSWLKRP